jgi:3-oxoacyl-[acyl-carrier-protein] synthase III
VLNVFRSASESGARSGETTIASIYVAALASHHPEGVVTNRDLEASLDTTSEWIERSTGILQRRRVQPGENAGDLAIAATRRALANAGWLPRDLDLIVCATSSSDMMLPAAATYLGHALGVDAVAFDVNAACAGFAYGMAAVRSMMTGMGYRKAALCCSDTYTRFVDDGDRRTAVLFGDGAATVLLQSERPAWGAEVVDVALENWKDGLGLVSVPVGGTWHMEGRKVTGPALKLLADCSTRVLERNHLVVEDLRVFIAHQANYRMLESLVEHLGVNPSQHWSNVREKGNQGAAGALAAFAEGVERHGSDLLDGDPILVTVVGAGFTSGSVLLRWIRRD